MFRHLFAALLMLIAGVATAQQGPAQSPQRFGDLLVHHNAFNSSYLQPEIAAAAGLQRGPRQGVVNIAVQRLTEDGVEVVDARIEGTVTNLLQQTTPLRFIRIQEEDAIYFVANYSAGQRGLLRFEVKVQADDNARCTRCASSRSSIRMSKAALPFSRLVLASNNAGKLKELQAMLGDDIEVLPQREFTDQEADETGLSFVENAILKARHAARASGLPALADDSGLAVDALGGAPGIYSARYADGQGDAANNAKLLQALRDVPDAERGARFICALALVRHAEDPVPIICEGAWEGRILHAARGEHGFGYDPLFLIPELGLSSAELPARQKNQLSHRARAMQQLRARLGLA